MGKYICIDPEVREQRRRSGAPYEVGALNVANARKQICMRCSKRDACDGCISKIEDVPGQMFLFPEVMAWTP